MNTIFRKPKGTRDIHSIKSDIFQWLQNLSFNVLNKNCYKLIIFPTFEYENFLKKSLGLNSLLISKKEIYSLNDKKGRILALRPEGTSSVMRMIMENKMIDNQYQLKTYYWSNMFRYERPQKNRYREFWQLGVELINSEGIISDFEIINLSNEILSKILDNYIFEINYLGEEETKKKYKIEIEKNINNKKEKNFKFCNSCERKIENKNFLEIIECLKCQNNEEIKFFNCSFFFSKKDLEYIKKLKELLSTFKIPYIFNEKLIRGIEYYTGLVFEIKIKNEEKSLAGGGRYDNLYEKIFKKKIPAVGFAIGIDRLINYLVENYEKYKEKKIFSEFLSKRKTEVFFVSLKNEDSIEIIKWRKTLQEEDILSEYNLEFETKFISKIIKLCDPKLLIIFDKIDNKKLKVKNVSEGKVIYVKKTEILDYIKNFFKDKKKYDKSG